METNRLIIKFKNQHDIPNSGIKSNHENVFSNTVSSDFPNIGLKPLYSKKYAISEYLQVMDLPKYKSFSIGNEFYLDELFSSFDTYEQEKSKVFILEAKNKEELNRLYHKIKDSDLLEYVEYDTLINFPEIDDATLPLDPDKEPNEEVLQQINAINCWDLATGKGINIAVLDSGINFINEDLKDQLWTDQNGNFGRHFYENQSESFDVKDSIGHGTKVSGIIGAKTNNEIGINGIASGSKIITIKLSSDSDNYFENSALCRAIDYAIQQKAKIISISWTSNMSLEYNKHATEMLNSAINKGIIIVCCTNDTNSDVKDHFPANIKEVITVGTISRDNSLCGSYGEGIDIFAAAEDWSSFDYITNSVKSLSKATSWGPPQVCSLIAMMLEINPNLSQNEILTYIQENAKIINTEGKTQYSIRLIDVLKTLEFVKNLKTNLKLKSHEKQQLGNEFPY